LEELIEMEMFIFLLIWMAFLLIEILMLSSFFARFTRGVFGLPGNSSATHTSGS
jgi:hypothetical protein